MAPPFRIVGLQVAAVGAVCLLMLFSGFGQAGSQVGSAVLGGAVIVLPNALFALGAARRLSVDSNDARLREARRVIALGAVKWMLSAVLIVAALSLVTVRPFGFFAALIVAVVAQAIAPVLPWADAPSRPRAEQTK